MRKFNGLRSIRRLIELILGRLAQKEEQLEEIERQLVLEMWNQGGNEDMDISWVASQESVNALQADVTAIKEDIGGIKNSLTSVISKLDAIGPAVDPFYGYEVAPLGEISKWTYTLDDTNETVTLSSYIGTDPEVVVYDAYTMDGGDIYRTIITPNSTDIANHLISANSRSIITSFRICNNTIDRVGTSFLFRDCTALEVIDFGENFDASPLTSIARMFSECSSLRQIIGFEKLDLSNVTNLLNAFYDCTSLEAINLSALAGNAITSIDTAFYNCSSLTSLDLSMINTSGCTKFMNLFYGCSSLKSINLSGFDVSGAGYSNNYGMFEGCSSLETLDLRSFNISAWTSLKNMFKDCSSLVSVDLTSFNTAKVSGFQDMFANTTSLQQVLVSRSAGWTLVNGSTGATYWFNGSNISEVTYVD